MHLRFVANRIAGHEHISIRFTGFPETATRVARHRHRHCAHSSQIHCSTCRAGRGALFNPAGIDCHARRNGVRAWHHRVVAVFQPSAVERTYRRSAADDRCGVCDQIPRSRIHQGRNDGIDAGVLFGSDHQFGASCLGGGDSSSGCRVSQGFAGGGDSVGLCAVDAGANGWTIWRRFGISLAMDADS